MDLQLNTAEPLVMYIDLNSCFATIEQQANPLIRNKPVIIAAYDKPFGAILSPSIEAKRVGIKMGMTVQDAKLIYPQVIVRTPDPPKYRFVHDKFMEIFSSYSPDVTAKSIDEAVINFSPFLSSFSFDFAQDRDDKIERKLMFIAREIKQRIRSEIGEYISCSIGIGTNRWWAKTGAGYKKPDGLTLVTHETIRDILKNMHLLDLCGINVRYQLRLNRYGIYTPLQFLDAPLTKLKKQVFQSIVGDYWYMRLRGWEIDSVEFERKSFGQQYALTNPTAGQYELSKLLMKLCEKMGRRLREAEMYATGVHLACSYRDGTHWHQGKTFSEELYTTYDLFQKIMLLFNRQPERKTVTKLAVTCFNLNKVKYFQDGLFDEKRKKLRKIAKTLDNLNDKYGEYVVTPAMMIGTKHYIIDRIAFGKAGLR